LFRLNVTLENLRIQVASLEAQVLLSFLGLITGLLAGLIIVVFRLTVDMWQAAILPGHQADNFEELHWFGRLLLPTLGGLGIGLLQEFAHTYRTVGVTHVLERIAYYQGRLPWRNALEQFLTASLALICGHSVGRISPSVHLGAASGSLLGQWLALPNNALRTLVACGIAAAIAASFNTPLAGVIFAIEIIFVEYQLVGVIPIILAAVAGAGITWGVFGTSPVFSVPQTGIHSLFEIPYLVLVGLAAGILAVSYNQALRFFFGLGAHRPLWQRCTAGGLVVGLCAITVPEVMGIGYDTINATLLGEIGPAPLFAIAVTKLIATTACIGLGVPGGLIGPTLVIGTAAGGFLGVMGIMLGPDQASSLAIYGIAGMAAMLSATLQAPLAALMLLLELTANPHILFPGMLSVVVANLVARGIFQQEPLFLMVIHSRGLDYQYAPASLRLRQAGVASVMDRRFVELPVTVSREIARQVLAATPRWVLVKHDSRPRCIMPAADIAKALNEGSQEPLNLMEIPATRADICPVSFYATLEEALEILNKSHAEMLYVERITAPLTTRIYGVLSRQDIEAYYH
jgi:chloride channel protein, CIC family